jgi:hypothetical protein
MTTITDDEIFVPNVTRHARERLTERAGINKRSVNREAERAHRLGLSVEHFSGKMRKYLHSISVKHQLKHEGEATVIKVYGNNVYLFAGDSELITTWTVPPKYRIKKRYREYEFPVEEIEEGYE